MPFVLPYLPFLIVFGIAPMLYALDLAFTNDSGGWAGFTTSRGRSTTTASSPRSSTSCSTRASGSASLIVFVVGLALLLHGRASRASSTFRFLFYMPGALAGAASVLVWLFMLDPAVSPGSFLLHHVLGAQLFVQSIAPGHLPFVFAMIAFWTGAGGWIVVMYGALNTIPHELEEAARIDGAGPVTIALRLKLPLIRKWIAYMVDPLVRHRDAALRRAAAGEPGEPRPGPRHLVVEPAGLPAGLPVRGLQRRRRHRRRPARDRPARRGADRHAHRAVQEGGLMRLAARGVRLVILAAFAVFFVVPVLWLILAPTKSDGALVTSSPLSFGSFHQLALAWDHLDAFSDHIYRTWIGNSLLYAFSATAIVLVTAIPAGYGLALGNFPGRRLVLTLTLVVMIMPAAALVLPIFLELNALHLIGSVLSVILPFSFFPFGVYLAYIYYATAIPRDLLDAARVDGCRRVADVPPHRAAAGQAHRRARLLLQLRGRLEQLLPALRRARGLVAVPDPGRPVGPAVVDPLVQPGRGRRRSAGEHLPAGAGAGHAARRHPRRDRVPAVAAGAGARAARRSGEAVTMTHASITASVPLLEPPGWALAERQLFDLLDHAWRRFARDFTGPDGRLNYRHALTSRDGVDDFYETFFNWPQLYLLGGADDLLAQAERHWEGVTAQLTELGMLSGRVRARIRLVPPGREPAPAVLPDHGRPGPLGRTGGAVRRAVRRSRARQLRPRPPHHPPSRTTARTPAGPACSTARTIPGWTQEARSYGFPLDWLVPDGAPEPERAGTRGWPAR